MNVFSAFDGCSCAQAALERAEIPVEHYYASEIDKYAIMITQKNYPGTIQLGDIQSVNPFLLPHIDLMIGGSPCQDLSIAGSRRGLNGERSGLFFDFIRLLRYLQPQYFVLENVASMSKLSQFIITQFMGVEPVMIDSALVSAQQRKRLYWTNFPVQQPADKGILLKDAIESGSVNRDKAYCLDANYYKGVLLDHHYRRRHLRQIVFNTEEDKIHYLSGKEDLNWRMLTSMECERLQTLPDHYTEGVSNTQRYKMLGNGFTVDVIAHILKGIQ